MAGGRGVPVLTAMKAEQREVSCGTWLARSVIHMAVLAGAVGEVFMHKGSQQIQRLSLNTSAPLPRPQCQTTPYSA